MTSTDAYGLYFEEMKRVIGQSETSVNEIEELVTHMWQQLDNRHKAVYEHKAAEKQNGKISYIGRKYIVAR